MFCFGRILIIGIAFLVLAAERHGPVRCSAAEAPGEKVLKETPALIGKVRWYRKGKRIEIDGKFCLDSGLIEYLAVLKGGKEYESILSFDCSAINLNLALIGSGFKSAGGVKKIGDPDTPKGDPLYLHLEWKTKDGKLKKVRAEDLLWNKITKKPMRKAVWVFTGSHFQKDEETGKLVFMAESERKLIAVYRDPAAMFNNPLDTGDDDIYYMVNEKVVPKPLQFACPDHPKIVTDKEGRCPECDSPLIGLGRHVTLVLTAAPLSEMAPEKLKDGAADAKKTGEENAPSYKGPTKDKKKEASEK